jgi:hypothetical protein
VGPIKLNVDAALDSHKSYLAVVARDNKGEILNAWTKKVRIDDPLVAETNVVYWALELVEHINYNDLIYKICNASIIIRHLIKNICDVLNLINMSDIELDFFIRWRVIIKTLQRLYIKPLQRIWSRFKNINVKRDAISFALMG